MIRQKNYDPAQVRSDLQSRYDAYRSRRRTFLGMFMPDVNLEAMGSNSEERESALKQITDKWPRKTQGLIKNIAKEILFERQSIYNHTTNADSLSEGFRELGVSTVIPLIWSIYQALGVMPVPSQS